MGECTDFFTTECPVLEGSRPLTRDDVMTARRRLWLQKPKSGQSGNGIKIYRGCRDLVLQYKSCSGGATNTTLRAGGYASSSAIVKSNSDWERQKRNNLVMEYVESVLVDGHKADLRTYMLVASTAPRVVFYHDGYVRKATRKYNTADLTDAEAHITNSIEQDKAADHFWDLRRFSEYMVKEEGFAPDFYTRFREQTMAISKFVFRAAEKEFPRRRGAFQLFGLDWVIERRTGQVHFLEANGNPLSSNYPIPGFPEMYETLMDLVIKVQTDPKSLPGHGVLTLPFQYKGWHLVYNELEEPLGQYNSCEALRQVPSWRLARLVH